MYTISMDDLEEMVLDAGLDPSDMTADYSGRGMYGETCLAYTGDNPTAFAVALALTVEGTGMAGETTGFGIVTALDNLGEARTDSMGLGAVHYWPRVQVGE